MDTLTKLINSDLTKYSNLDNLFEYARLVMETDLSRGLELNDIVRTHAALNMKAQLRQDVDMAQAFRELYKKTFLLAAPHRFDDYMIYLEYNRTPSERFYQPRRKRLKVVVDAMQDLTDDELDELFVSMPPRIGKTTLCMFYITWMIGRNPEGTNLYSAFSDTITSGLYEGVLEVITDNYTYNWGKIFNQDIARTNSKKYTIDIERKKRYPSLTCRSLYGTLNGACDCNSILMADDLLSGIEEAMNMDRLNSAWSKVDNNLLPRAKESAKVIWVGTRWSLFDPIGKRLSVLESNDKFSNHRYKVLDLPALDENDESNFDYDYGVGFSTDYYHKRRASFENNNDMASWLAQYMAQPIERDGALFTPNEMNFYNGVLPQGEPDRVYAAVDVAFGGGDYLSMPICYEYGDVCYVHDWVFNNGDKKVTQPLVTAKVNEHKLDACQFEANNGGAGYKDDIERILKDQYQYRLNITSRSAPTNKRKEQRIFDKSPEIRELYFLESGKRSKEYELAMKNLYSFKMIGKNKNDDAPDSLAMLIDMKNNGRVARVEVFSRPF